MSKVIDPTISCLSELEAQEVERVKTISQLPLFIPPQSRFQKMRANKWWNGLSERRWKQPSWELFSPLRKSTFLQRNWNISFSRIWVNETEKKRLLNIWNTKASFGYLERAFLGGWFNPSWGLVQGDPSCFPWGGGLILSTDWRATEWKEQNWSHL